MKYGICLKEEMTTMTEIKETGGKGALYFALIPAALAGAALMWLAFYTGIVDWTKLQRIEARMDNRVGVNGQLTAPVDLIIRGNGCLHVSRAFLDDGSLTVYLTSSCPQRLDYWEIHWNQVAPDGTTISNGYTNHVGTYGSTGIDAGETIELKEDLKDDSRTTKVIVWSKDHS